MTLSRFLVMTCLSLILAVSAPLSALSGQAQPEAGQQAALLDLNEATVEQLQQLPGVGPVKAQRIVEYRENGRFATVEQLLEVSGIGRATLDNIRHLVTVNH